MKTELFICRCYNIEHQLVFSAFDDCLLVSTHLTPEYNIWKRIWYGIKYIFGYKCRYGHFDEFIFNPDDYIRLRNFLDEQINNSNNNVSIPTRN